MYLERNITEKLKKITKIFPIIILAGARQVGKSTLLQKIFPNYDYVVFDPIIDIENARTDPELFLKNHKTPLILDEIQCVPELIPVLKRTIDKNKKPNQFILTGSQQWEVLKNISESLAGRAVFLNLHNFSLHEISQKKYNKIFWLQDWLENPKEFFKNKKKQKTIKTNKFLFEQLWTGFYPEAQNIFLEFIPDFYNSYIKTYIERDVRKIANVEDQSLFRRYVGLIAALTAQEINYNQIGRELGITHQTAKRWLNILIGTFLWYEIPCFSMNMIKKISKKPKGYLSDTGLICNLQAISNPQVLASYPMWGSIFETAVVNQIIKIINLFKTPPKLYHWRSHGGAEVDLILEYNGAYYPIEIKANSNPKSKDIRGLIEFKKTYANLDIKAALVLCPTENIYTLAEDIYCIPWDLY